MCLMQARTSLRLLKYLLSDRRLIIGPSIDTYSRHCEKYALPFPPLSRPHPTDARASNLPSVMRDGSNGWSRGLSSWKPSVVPSLLLYRSIMRASPFVGDSSPSRIHTHPVLLRAVFVILVRALPVSTFLPRCRTQYSKLTLGSIYELP